MSRRSWPGRGDTEPDVVFACTDSTGASSRIYARFAGSKPDTVQAQVQAEDDPGAPGAVGERRQVRGRGVMFWNKGRDAMVTWHGANLNCATTKE